MTRAQRDAMQALVQPAEDESEKAAGPRYMLTLNICDVDLVQPLNEVQWDLVCSIAGELGVLRPGAGLTPLQTAAILRRVGAIAPLYFLPSREVAPHEQMADVIERSTRPS